MITSNRGVSVACVSVKSLSVFPALQPCESDSFYQQQKFAGLAFARLGNVCKVVAASLPKFDLYVIVGMLTLATL